MGRKDVPDEHDGFGGIGGFGGIILPRWIAWLFRRRR